MNNNEIEKYKDLYALMGISLISSQRMEFLSQGIVCLYKNIAEDKQFKDLEPKSFFDDSDAGRRLRKKTLGQLINKTKVFDIIDNGRLDNYISVRNLIVHNLWREELYEKKQNKDLDKCIKLCSDFISESSEIERVFRGFMFSVYRYIKENNDFEPLEKFEQWQIFEKDFDKYNK